MRLEGDFCVLKKKCREVVNESRRESYEVKNPRCQDELVASHAASPAAVPGSRCPCPGGWAGWQGASPQILQSFPGAPGPQDRGFSSASPPLPPSQGRCLLSQAFTSRFIFLPLGHECLSKAEKGLWLCPRKHGAAFPSEPTAPQTCPFASPNGRLSPARLRALWCV